MIARRFVTRALVGAAVIAVATVASCTTFDGLTLPPQPGGAGGGGAGAGTTSASGGGGAGGVSAGGGAPVGYLDLDDAVRLCGLAEECDALAASLFLATGLPIGQAADATFASVTVNASICTTLLAGPLPPFQPGVAERRALLEQAAAMNDCAGAVNALPVRVVLDDPAPCAHGSRCSGDKSSATLCDTSVIELECGSVLFPSQTCTLAACGLMSCGGSVTCAGTAEDIGAICLGMSSTVAMPVNCSILGLNCTAGACVTADNAFMPCNGAQAGTATCSGSMSTLYACNGFLVSDLDCAGTGATCTEDDGTLGIGAYCKDPMIDCAPGTSSCNGDTLTVCVAGTNAMVDCTTLGGSCAVDHCHF